MNARHILAALAPAILPVVFACSSLDSGSDLPSLTSFHYVRTTEWTYDGETGTQREEGYRVGDAARIAYEPGDPYQEVIVIGRVAWARDSSGWFRQDRDFLASLALGFSESLTEVTETATTEDLDGKDLRPVRKAGLLD